MKVLLDTCVWGGAVKDLELAGHEVVWAGDWQEDPGDEEILKIAYHEERVLVTLDKDFGELAIIHRQPHSGIIRLVSIRARQQGSFCTRAIEKYRDDLIKGAIVTVEFDRTRIRLAEE